MTRSLAEAQRAGSGRRIGFDLSKAHHPDGIGTWQREMARALATTARPDRSVDDRWLGLAAAPDLDLGLDLAREGSTFELGAGSVTDPPPDLDVLVSSAWTVPRAFDGLLIFVVHDLTFLTHPHCHLVENRLHCLEGLLRAALLGRCRFVAVSRSTAEILHELVSPDLAVDVVPNGVDSFWTADAPSEPLPTELRDGEGGGEYVLSVGSLEPRKNLHRLWQAHRRLDPELRRRYPLALVGGHGWKNEDLLARLRGDPEVHVLGRVSRPLLRTLYKRAALFVYPSLAEGFGLPVVEAMACAAPVLTSDTTSLPEVAGDVAVQVDPREIEDLWAAMDALLRDPDRRRHMAERGPARAAGFDWRSSARRLLDLIHG